MTIKALYPTVRPTLNLDFAKTKALDPRVTFTRASTATFVGANGLIQTAASGAARFDHNPATGESLGLLVEEARTNSQVRSQEFSDAAWTASEATVLPNAFTAPDGTLTASKLIESSANAQHRLTANTSGIIASGGTYTLSLFARAAERSILFIGVGDRPNVFQRAYFDLESQVVTSAGVNGTVVGTSITPMAGGYYRISMTTTSSTWDGTTFFDIGLRTTTTPDSNSNFTNSTYQGDGASGIYIWGAQLEAGSFPTSYIPTVATFTGRASTATFYNSSGVIQTAASGVARSNAFFPDSSGVMRSAGLLLEAAGTNVNTYSQNFATNTYWVNLSASAIVDNATAAPDGATTASNFKISVNTGTTNCSIYKNFTLTANTLNTFSIFAKPNTYSWIAIYSGGYTNDMGLTYFDLSNGVIGNVGANVSSYKIEKLANGWKRISVTWDPGSDNVGNIRMSLATANGDFTNIPWDGVASVYIWGAQLEASPYPTSYIPTVASTVTRAADTSTSATVTRAADVASMTGTNFSSWYNPAQSTILAKLQNVNASGATSIWSFDDNTSSQRIMFRVGTGTQITNFSNISDTANPYTATHAFAITANSLSGAKNGTLYAAPTGTSVPIVTQLQFGVSPGVNRSSGTISRFTYYPVRLPDATLQAITAT